MGFPPFENTKHIEWTKTTTDLITIQTDSYVGVWVNGHYTNDYMGIYYTSPDGKGPVLVADRPAQNSDNDDEHFGIWYAFVKKGSVISVKGSGRGCFWRYFITPLK